MSQITSQVINYICIIEEDIVVESLQSLANHRKKAKEPDTQETPEDMKRKKACRQ